jgi:hypothetical protein
MNCKKEDLMMNSGSGSTAAGDGDGSRNEERSTGQAKADLAVEAAPGERASDENLQQRQDELLDEAVEETFPASDPISPKRITK